MKILFICYANAERSQVAEVLFNIASKKHKAISAGTWVKKEKRSGKPAGRIMTELLLSMGHSEIEKKKRKQLTRDLAQKADRIIVMLSEKQIEQTLPAYVKNSPKTEFWKLSRMRWEVYDSFPPYTYTYHARWVSEIHHLVEELVKEIE